ncbi:MAG: hypothetical protein LBL82_06380 [Oscillospiraceae bacterium]|jgi:hypothetical protein|nr:hypothetical protein [Oscillospiraceae bacterium]
MEEKMFDVTAATTESAPTETAETVTAEVAAPVETVAAEVAASVETIPAEAAPAEVAASVEAVAPVEIAAPVEAAPVEAVPAYPIPAAPEVQPAYNVYTQPVMPPQANYMPPAGYAQPPAGYAQPPVNYMQPVNYAQPPMVQQIPVQGVVLPNGNPPKGKKSKKALIISLSVVAGLIALLVGAWFLVPITYLGGEFISTKTTELDLSGGEIPNTIMLARMDNLETLNISGINLTETELGKIMSAVPGCDIIYDVNIGNKTLLSNMETITSADIGEGNFFTFASEVGKFYALKKIDLTIQDDISFDAIGFDEYDSLALSVGEGVEIIWSVPVGEDVYVNSDAEDVQLTRISGVSSESIQAALPYFTNVKSFNFGSFGVSQADLEAINTLYPACDVQFSHVTIGNSRLALTATSAYIGDSDEADSITDIGMIKYLEKLEYIEFIYQSKITDFSPLNSLTKLTEVTINGSNVDLNAFANIPNLTGLSIVNIDANIDLTPLQKYAKLKTLYIFKVGITTIKPLAKCDKLQTLNLFYTSVKDCMPLKDCKSLKELHLGFNAMKMDNAQKLKNAKPRIAITWYT